MATTEELLARIEALEAQLKATKNYAQHHALEHADHGDDPFVGSNVQGHTHASGGGSHDAVTLGADIVDILGLVGQELRLDAQAANSVFAGPTSGGGADPTFRALVAADISAAIPQAQYLTLATHADLTVERRFMPSTGLSETDGGAGGDYTLKGMGEVYIPFGSSIDGLTF